MIQLSYRRTWLGLVIAAAVNDHREQHVALGLTERGAGRRVCRRIDRNARRGAVVRVTR